MRALRVAHVWGDQVLDLKVLEKGSYGPLTLDERGVFRGTEKIDVPPEGTTELTVGTTTLRLSWVASDPKPAGSKGRDWGRVAVLGVLALLIGVVTVLIKFRPEHTAPRQLGENEVDYQSKAIVKMLIQSTPFYRVISGDQTAKPKEANPTSTQSPESKPLDPPSGARAAPTPSENPGSPAVPLSPAPPAR